MWLPTNVQREELRHNLSAAQDTLERVYVQHGSGNAQHRHALQLYQSAVEAYVSAGGLSPEAEYLLSFTVEELQDEPELYDRVQELLMKLTLGRSGP